ncbi:hypothetical protein GCM10010520_49060 [Rhizobium viscosum]|uniref:Uncharacterized protein n=1 Tax=Rhizobium viscosum TaxID=1673 RepID=A0ABR9IR59_RHIVS|nr:hypothetical protein [Rhizobium viscosum]MBE1505662.1 hypothetical protein [Rhizobium viscosum]
MSRLLLAATLAITISAASQPAFAFGPGGFGRDLMYTSAIGRLSEEPLTTSVGFVRPNVPFALSAPAQVEGEGYQLKAYSRQLTIVIGFVFDSVLGQASQTIGAAEALGPFLR